MATETINTAVYKIRADFSGLPGDLKKADTIVLGNIEKSSKEASSSIEKTLDTATKATKSSSKLAEKFAIATNTIISNVVSKTFNAVTDGVKSFSSGILSVGSGFESTMAQVSAISGAAGDELQSLNDKARELGAATKYSASEVGEGFTYMAMAGWETDDMLSGINGMLNLATAGCTNLGTASDIVTDNLTAFGLSAKDTDKMVDAMAATVTGSNTTVGLMGETLKYVGATAGALGYSFEDCSVAIGLMANAGIKGSQSGTALRSIMNRLANDTSDCATVLKDMGVEVVDTDGNMRDFGDVMTDMRGVFAGLSEEQKAQLASTIAGTEGMSGLLAIVNASDEDYAKLTESINNSSGAAQEMADIMGNTTEGRIKALQSKIQELQLKAFEALQPAIDAVIQALGWCADNAEMLIPIIVSLGAVIAGVKFVSLAKKISSSLSSAFGVAKKFANKITNVFTKDIGVTASTEAGNAVEKVGSSMSSKISSLSETITAAFKALGDILSSAVSAVLEPVKTLLAGVGQAIAGFFQAFSDPMIVVGAAIFAAAAASIAAAILLIGAAIGLTMPNWEALFNNIIMPTAIFIRDTLLLLIDNLTNSIIRLTNEALIPIADFIVGSFLNVVNQITDAIIRFTQGAIIPLVNTLSGALMGVLRSVSDFLNSTFKTAFEGIKGVVESVGTAFEKMGNVVVGALNSVNGILSTFKDLLLGVADAIVAVVALATGQSVNYGNGFARVTKAATGGRVYGIGTSTSDSNLFALSKGEYVIKASSARQIGYENLDQLNENGYLSGVSGFDGRDNNTYNIDIHVDGVFATSDAERRKVADQIVEAINQNNRRRFA